MMWNRFPTLSVSVLLLFISSIVILSSISNLSANAEVITLTTETFSDKVQEKDTAWFVKFCVPWCKHCKNLGTLWEDLGKEMEGEDEVEIGEVDCATNKPVCSKVDIHSYPTFKLFYNGEEVTKYQGSSIGCLINWESPVYGHVAGLITFCSAAVNGKHLHEIRRHGSRYYMKGKSQIACIVILLNPNHAHVLCFQ
ncbi:protein disulfide isomerase-like 5-1 isoform X1 [Sesamum indicum]|uniref:Protein disulfide isomerase-like 5-1 isoform X1 n=1 Tax=Sesamum indicum TaxID=4182 RepID=A0A8M8V8C8_SESIN|nr:protein disulfide isomerase-like 5-1 isoform X1 [Sesamum indicum]